MFHRGEAVDKAFEKYADKNAEHVDLQHYHIVGEHYFNPESMREVVEHDGQSAPQHMRIVVGTHADGTGPHIQGIKFDPAHHSEASVQRFAKTLNVRHPEVKEAILEEHETDNMKARGE